MRRGRALLGVLALAAAGATLAQTPAPSGRDLARDSYREFLRLAPADDPRRASALRRLADIELERAEQLEVDGDDLAAAAATYGSAIALYEELLSAFPGNDGNDAVLYQLARAHEHRGEREAAVARLGELVRDFAASDYADEAHFRRGEAFFSAGDFDLAAEAYNAILASDAANASAFYEQALYKQGWSQFRLGEYRQALDGFLVLLNHELAPQGEYDAAHHAALAGGKRELLEDALRAMSISYAYLDGVAALDALLTRSSAPGFEFLLYQDLGNHYLEQERFSDAAGAYSTFVTSYPDATHAPHLQLRVIDTYAAAGFAAQELAAREAFVERYALTRRDGYWASHDIESSTEVVAAMKDNLTGLSRHYHALAQETGEPAAVDQAQRFYLAWLSSFPLDPEAPQTHFLLAELLYAQQRFAAATDAYEATAYGYGAHERAAEAGYASLLAYSGHEAQVDAAARAAWQRRSIAAALRFAQAFPLHAEAHNVLVNAAERLFELGDLDAAAQAGGQLLAVQPAAAPALRYTAWTVVGHARFDLGEYALAEQAYLEVLALSAPDDARRQDTVERLAAAVYRQGEARRAAGDLSGAVEDFLRVARVAPQSRILATAEYDAAQALIALNDWRRAADVLAAFRAHHPGHELANDVTRNLSYVYLQDGRKAEAAGELERIARDDSFEPQVRHDALLEAVALYRDSGDVRAEAQALGFFLTRIPGTLDEGIDARERLAALAADSGDSATEQAWQREIVNVHATAAAPTERSRSAAATAALKLADVGLPAFAAQELRIPLRDSLRAKKASMEALLAAYGAAADYGVGPVTTAATFRIAELYREMSRALMASERPAELNELELEEYEFLLEEQSFPFEERAIEVHEANAQRSGEGTYDEWVRGSFAQLALLLPARYAKMEKGEVFATLAD